MIYMAIWLGWLQVFVGRLAMSGFLAGTVGELLTGKGFFGQLALGENKFKGCLSNAL